ncbi:MAG TPA: glycosyltransferase family 2 protein [Gemmatimonadales bacterium]
MNVALWVVIGGVAFAVYTYAGYPAILRVLARRASTPAAPDEWPMISLTVPVYNEEHVIAETLEQILAIDYPRDRMQVLVVSDASSDGTDSIVASYAGRGVELLRQPARAGKTAAENAARLFLRGDIIINTDASVRIAPDAVRRLVLWFSDPTVGVASGRDVSVAQVDETANVGESGYVGYEMWVRDLETAADGIVGASGCFYAIRRQLHMELVPAALSRDFAAAMIAREAGLRAVSVPDAVCYVPRASSLRKEYRRKVRTITRGMETLWDRRRLMNPLRFGRFSWMLFTHKACRWLLPWAAIASLMGLGALALDHLWARVLVGLVIAGGLFALAGWLWPEDRKLPRLLALPTFAVAGNLAALHASLNAMRGERNPTWEPTRRKKGAG